ncbi:hypothetical protein ARALYDRAFT_901951 [Arabidopsis lyrata subsp. lyrata]|uniref:Plant heme peroxidase family profile domain-containing protein n=1 Tax=Arabidopsis lyrata subsp. lyrata TaxID=81972 RepID=D7LLD3_ARALL|nr:hypothetical protein ARALYDRAFT_901951 [Arabidopsis lyrata subsp. lyrata]
MAGGLALRDGTQLELPCQSRTGGPFGTMRFDAEQAHGANSGIHIALRLFDPIREQFPTISFLAEVVAVEVTGGPEIPFYPGREDKPQPPPEGRLPDATKTFDH